MGKFCYRGWILALDVLLACGLVAYSVMFLTLNKTLNPAELEGAGTLISWRLLQRQIAEGIVTFCGLVYCIGHVILAWSSVRKGKLTPIKRLALYFVSQLLLMALCSVPFGLFDTAFFEDYVFPIWGLSGTLCVILSLYAAVSALKRTKGS